MRAGTRTVVAVVALLLAVGASAAPAGAHVQDLTVDDTATLREDLGGAVEVRGSITCTFGEDYSLRIQVRQRSGTGANPYTFGCESGPDSFSLAVFPDTGSFSTGPALVRITARTTDGHQVIVKQRVTVVAQA